MEKTTVQIQQEIKAGEAIAVNIKNYFYPDQAWSPKLAFEIGHKLRDIKRAASKFYTNLDILLILHNLLDFKKEDLEDLLLTY
jgi:hypothetical protein